MGDKTGISWTDSTWNPTTGCDTISPGCDNCYAMRDAPRLQAMMRANNVDAYQRDGTAPRSGPGFGFQMYPERFAIPRRWHKSDVRHNRTRRVFVNSMSDLFHEQIDVRFLEAVFDVMHECPRHTFQILTKRHRNMHRLLAGGWPHSPCSGPIADHRQEPAQNIWLGVSVENQQWADARIPWLLKTPAAVRWLSCEPLLGPLDLSPWLSQGDWWCDACDAYISDAQVTNEELHENCRTEVKWKCVLDWVVVGGESGPGWRPMEAQWARDIRDQCVDAGVALHFKQWSGLRPKALGRELDGRTWDEYPEVAL